MEEQTMDARQIIEAAWPGIRKALQLQDGATVWLRPSRVHPRGVYAVSASMMALTMSTALRNAVRAAMVDGTYPVEWFEFSGRARPFLRIAGDAGAMPSGCTAAAEPGDLDVDAPDEATALVNLFEMKATAAGSSGQSGTA